MLDRRDVRVDTFRASGAGGQHRNKTDSGVRLTHLPTGTVVTATEERSQHQNRAVAWQRLSARLASRTATDRSRIESVERAACLADHRSFVWTAWRNEVRTSSGRRARMDAAPKGRISPLLE